MVITGTLCKGCGGPGRCDETYTHGEIGEVDCPACEGSREFDCPECENKGRFQLSSCPQESVGSEIRDVCEMSSLAQKGVFPLAGGGLDQSAWFIEAWNRLEHDVARIREEQAKRRSKL